MMVLPRASIAVTIAALAAALPVHAHEGHDDAPSMPPTTLGGAPRLEAHSDLFELIGVIDGGVMTLYLDRYATNEPLANAVIEIEAGEAKGVAQANPDGTYSFKNPALATPGPLSVTFAINAGGESDLLTSELVGPERDRAGVHSTASFFAHRSWWWWSAGGLLLLCLVALLLLSRRGLWRRGRRFRERTQ